jgi:hypothetical protein
MTAARDLYYAPAAEAAAVGQSGAPTGSANDLDGEHTVNEIVVTGRRLRGAAIHTLADPLAIKSGNFAINVAGKVDEAIRSTPGARTAVTLIDWGLRIAGGPVRAAVGEVVGRVSAEAAQRLTDRFESKGYSDASSRAGGVGGPILATLLTQGVNGALQIASVFGGIRIVNHHLAGDRHSSGIPFDKDGFPDFSGVSIRTVTITQTGRRSVDNALANRAAGIAGSKPPRGYTWHHHQDGRTMQLVPRDIHRSTGHTGGVAVNKGSD